MARKVRFYTDENISRATINGLRQMGADVLSTPDAGMLGATDDIHLALANDLRRVLVTQDRDFPRLNRRGFPHAGIIYADEGTSTSRMIAGLRRVYETKTPEDMAGWVEYV